MVDFETDRVVTGVDWVSKFIGQIKYIDELKRWVTKSTTYLSVFK